MRQPSLAPNPCRRAPPSPGLPATQGTFKTVRLDAVFAGNAATLADNSIATRPTELRGQFYADTSFTSLCTTLTESYINTTW